MNFQHENDGKKGSYFILTDSIKSAEMTCVWAWNYRIIINHTEVGE